MEVGEGVIRGGFLLSGHLLVRSQRTEQSPGDPAEAVLLLQGHRVLVSGGDAGRCGCCPRGSRLRVTFPGAVPGAAAAR